MLHYTTSMIAVATEPTHILQAVRESEAETHVRRCRFVFFFFFFSFLLVSFSPGFHFRCSFSPLLSFFFFCPAFCLLGMFCSFFFCLIWSFFVPRQFDWRRGLEGWRNFLPSHRCSSGVMSTPWCARVFFLLLLLLVCVGQPTL